MSDKFGDDVQAVLDALKSDSRAPAVLEMQRALVELLRKAARQLPEVQALLKAARDISEWFADDDPSLDRLQALRQAIEAFEKASGDGADPAR